MTNQGIIKGGSLSQVDDVAQNALGARMFDADHNEYIYLKGVADTVIGAVVTFDEAHQTALLAIDGSNKGRAAVAMQAVVANKFGWYQIYGNAQVLTDNDVADNALVYSSDTAGKVDDDSSSEVQVKGAVFRGARTGSGLVAAELNYPTVGIA